MKDNFSLTNLFMTKEVKIYLDDNKDKLFKVKVPTVRDLYLNDNINAAYHIWTLSKEKRQQILNLKDNVSSWDFFVLLESVYGKIKEFMPLTQHLCQALRETIPGIEINQAAGKYKVNDINITSEIWDYVLYILKLSCGEKVEKPMVFKTEAAKKFFLAQREADEMIKSLRENNSNGDSEALIKTFLRITYAFPSLTFDYLSNQTMAQIQWLAKYAAEAPSYEINAQALAAGNMKKGKKLEFFIK